MENKYSNPNCMSAISKSAGGLVIGQHLNNFGSTYFKSIIAKVPFVDLVGNISNTNIPLSTSEFDEWGNPNNLDQLKYMKSYDPMQNIKSNFYPHLYITGSLNDIRVPFSDPLKWVCAIRDSEINSEGNLALIDIFDDIGHTEDLSGIGIIEDKAKIFAFLTHTLRDL